MEMKNETPKQKTDRETLEGEATGKEWGVGQSIKWGEVERAIGGEPKG